MSRINTGIVTAAAWLAVAAVPVLAQQRTLTPEQIAERERAYREELATPNPLEASESVWIEELTWIEVRDRIADGYTTAIIPTGGIEQNGPYLATGKHNVIVEALGPAIADKLGNALCAPIVPFVPEGKIDPPSGAMMYPGSITVRDETYQALLEDGLALGTRLHDPNGGPRISKAPAAALQTSCALSPNSASLCAYRSGR